MDNLEKNREDYIISVLLNTFSKVNCASFSQVITFYKEPEIQIFADAKMYYDIIYQDIVNLKNDYASSLKINNPAERKITVDIIGSSNLEDNAANLIKRINNELAGKNISYRLPVNLDSPLDSIIQKCRQISTAFKCLTYLKNYDFVHSNVIYIEKFLKFNGDLLEPTFVDIYQTLREIALDPMNYDKAFKKAYDCLIKISYTDVVIKDKDLEDLAAILTKELISCEAVLISYKSNHLDFNTAIDNLANIIESRFGNYYFRL